MAYEIFIMIIFEVNMKELGEYLKETRKAHGVSVEEAAEDLSLSPNELENIESANIRAFKDVYHLRHLVKEYAKYLGLKPEDVQEEFNDFLFEHTSKISLDDIMEAKRKREEQEAKKVSSPYTKVYKKKINIWPIILVVLLFALFITISILVIKQIHKKPTINSELKGSVFCEYTY